VKIEVEDTERSAAIEAMTQEVAEWVKAKGWLDDRTFGDEIALLHSEASEALEAWRKHGFERWMCPYTTEPARRVVLDEGDTDYSGYKPEGVASEFADILIRLLDDCYRHGIDLYAEYRAKMAYNWTRAHRHGDKNL
jgi:NTP pyrophosphatase (non-canonical NTP hydrolase)